MKNFKFCLIVLIFFSATGSRPQSLPNSATKQYFKNLHDWLKDTVKVKAQLDSFATSPLDDVFDWQEITRQAFSENWVNLSVFWQKRFTQAARRRIIKLATADLIRLRSFLTQKDIRWDEESINKDRAKTSFDIIRNNDIEKVNLRIVLSDETWKVYDIRMQNFRLIRDVLGRFDDLITNGFNHEYVEAVMMNDSTFTIDNFNANESGDHPKLWGWRKKDDDEMRVNMKLYRIEKENENFYLSAQGNDGSIALVKPFSYNIKEYPYLSWRWRIREFPASKGNYQTPSRAAEIAVIYYQNWLGIPITLHYVWDSQASSCSTIRQEGFLFDSYVKVVRTESISSDEWFEENVNPFEDYRRIFGEDPPEQIIGIYLNLGSSSHSLTSKADFDDFVVKKATNSPSCTK